MSDFECLFNCTHKRVQYLGSVNGKVFRNFIGWISLNVRILVIIFSPSLDKQLYYECYVPTIRVSRCLVMSNNNIINFSIIIYIFLTTIPSLIIQKSLLI